MSDDESTKSLSVSLRKSFRESLKKSLKESQKVAGGEIDPAKAELLRKMTIARANSFNKHD